jgi:NAD(P)-dependent dehydrogenase (short-subunit alcohol dehydrogenase family)
MTPKTALITGGGTGLGLAIAQEFLAIGYRVVVFTPTWDPAKELEGTAALHEISVDLASPEQILQAFERTRALTDTIDVLVNNAAVFERAHFDELAVEVWEYTLRVNLTAPFLCCQQFCRMAAPNRAYIVNILSDAYYLGPRRGAHYAASKGGLASLTRSLARILGGNGIRVLGVAPGIASTRQSLAKAHQYDEIAKTIPLGRIAKPRDISQAVVALTSGAFDYMTGEILHLNGGRHMR